MDTKQEILNKTDALFMRYGIKSVTMDDIARELGISKKTLYQYVDNKQDLIEQIFQKHIQQDILAFKQIREEAVDSIDEILKVARYIIQTLRKVSPTTMYDLEKYYKKTWLQMKQLHNRYVYGLIMDNIQRGIEEGFYRASVKVDIIAKLFVGCTTLLVDVDLFPMDKYNHEALVRQQIIYHVYGIASPKGLALLDDHLESNLNHID